MNCLIDATILSAFSKGENLEAVQKQLAEKNINVDIDVLKKRSRSIKKR